MGRILRPSVETVRSAGCALILAVAVQKFVFGGLPHSVSGWAESFMGWGIGLVLYYGSYALWRGRKTR